MRSLSSVGAVAVSLLVIGAIAALWHDEPMAVKAGSMTVGIDADPTGNTATSLGSLQDCQAVDDGEAFDVDLFIEDVEELLAWQGYFTFDPSVLNLTAVDVELFQAANENSSIVDLSPQSLPDTDGLFFIAAADVGDRAEDRGSGVLARLTLKAVGSGTSAIALSELQLVDVDGAPIDDVDGDGTFDGILLDAEIRVSGECEALAPIETPTPTPPPQAIAAGDGLPWWAWTVIGVGIVLGIVFVFGALRVLRSR